MISEVFKFENLTFLAQGLWVTVIIASVSIICSFIIGIALGVARSSKHKVFGKMAGFYIEVIRNIPNLLFIIA
ncbi:MAG TPA: amino acid ABC transporter permease, partial [Firmicutes bacterium]|nr:amino acid ABC transporter permease [Bacillota bacterium]